MIIFGLGNPGLKYRSTRHNAGFILIDRIVKARGKRLSRKHGYSCIDITVGRSKARVTLVKPLLFMNRSGTIVSMIIQGPLDGVLVVVDDISLPLGKLRLRKKGSDGGHLGLRSIIQTVGSSDFSRLRIGVGMPGSAEQNESGIAQDIASHVLRPLSRHEKKILFRAIDKAIIGIEMLVDDGFEKAQNFINAVNVTQEYQDSR